MREFLELHGTGYSCRCGDAHPQHDLGDIIDTALAARMQALEQRQWEVLESER